jgi:hypothetical protein
MLVTSNGLWETDPEFKAAPSRPVTGKQFYGLLQYLCQLCSNLKSVTWVNSAYSQDPMLSRRN